MRRAALSDFFALVTCCTVDEVSITDRPCNPQALVRHRYPPSAHDGLYDAIGEKVRLLVQLTNTMKEQQAHVRVQPSR